jgi:L-arabinose isomerase
LSKPVAGFGVEVVSAGLVDTAPGAAEAAAFCARRPRFDPVYIGTYATSSQVLPVVQRAKVPVLVLNLQPCAALDYEHTDTGEWLANCSVCCRAGDFERLCACGRTLPRGLRHAA